MSVLEQAGERITTSPFTTSKEILFIASFISSTNSTSVLIKKAAGIKSGSGTPNSLKVGKVTRAQLEEIAKIKDPDLTAADMDAAVRTLSGSARSAGIEVEG